MERNRRRWTAVAVVGAMALTAACGGDDDEDEAASTTAAPAGGGATTVAGAGDAGAEAGEEAPIEGSIRVTLVSDFRDSVDPLIERFRAEQPGVDVDITAFPSDQYFTAARAEIGSGNPPDVLQVNAGYGNPMAVRTLADAGVLQDISGEEWVDVDEAYATTVGDGEAIYTIPMSFTMIATLYNRAVLPETEVPTTFPELLQTCESLAAEGVTPIALGAANPLSAQMTGYALAASTAYSANPDFGQQRLEGEVTFAEDEGWQQALDQFTQMSDAGCFGESPTGVPLEAMFSQVASGEAAMMVFPTAIIGQLQTLNPEGDFGIFAFPAAEAAEDVRMPTGLGFSFAVTERSENKEAALAFVEFMSRPENIEEYNELGGGLAVAESYDTLPPEYDASVAELLAEGRTVTYLDQLWPNAEVQQALQNGLQQLLLGQSSPEGILEAMDSAFQA